MTTYKTSSHETTPELVNGLANLLSRHIEPAHLTTYVNNPHELSEDDRDRLDDHLVVCSQCAKTVRSLRSESFASRAGEMECTVATSRVASSLNTFFRRVRREAIQHATRRLRSLNSTGVGRYRARSGWVFLLDATGRYLESVKGTAYNTNVTDFRFPVRGKGIVPHTLRSDEGFVTPDVNEVAFYKKLIATTTSEIAVPVYTPDRSSLGVYNLESNDDGAFTPAQVNDLKKNVVHLVPHLLVLKNAATSGSCQELTWHPEMHAPLFSPKWLLERFCQVVVRALKLPNSPFPSVTFWNVDSDRCWALATDGYDEEFVCLETLSVTSAVARTVLQEKRVMRGTPETLGFEELAKAARMGLKHAILIPINGDKSLNIYFFDDRDQSHMPSDEVVSWIAACAEQLIKTFYSQRLQLAVARMNAELARSPYAAGGFDAFLKVLMRCCDAEAGSIFARELNLPYLQCVETTGLEGVADYRSVRYHLQKHANSFTCQMASTGDVRRVNWGRRFDPVYLSRERTIGDSRCFRRLLGTGVKGGDEILGAVRLIRPALSPPFTQEDEVLLRALCESAKDLFWNWQFAQMDRVIPTYHCSTRARIALEFLPQIIAESRQLSVNPVERAAVFTRFERAKPEFREYAYFSEAHVLAPRDFEVSDDTVDVCRRNSDGILLTKVRERAGHMMSRICVPMSIWSGPNLVEAILVLDHSGVGHEWSIESIRRVFHWTVQLAAIWGWNTMRPDPAFLNDDDDTVIRAFLRHALRLEQENLRGVQCRITSKNRCWKEGESLAEFSCAATYSNRPLQRFGVEISEDGYGCRFPLNLGPIKVAEMECGFSTKLASRIHPFLGSTIETNDLRSINAFRELARCVAVISGSWSRLVAGNLSWWNIDYKTIKDDDHDHSIWRAFCGEPVIPVVEGEK